MDALDLHGAIPQAAPGARYATVRRPPRPGALLSLQAAVSSLAGVALTTIWAGTGAGYFWPVWAWLGLSAPLALHASVQLARRVRSARWRWLGVHAAVSSVLAVVVVLVWLLAGSGAFWPLWPLLGLVVVLAVNAVVVALWGGLSPHAREHELADRVDVLTRTRRGALDVQAAELRRIERDLHDGAQARLVALSMQLGRAEERLDDRPDVAELVRRARGEARAAVAELRDLARGIAPPVLADRGLAAAVEALGRRVAIPVTVEADIEHRPLPVLEAAAYFVVAESLTNAAKHAHNAMARVAIALDSERLVIEVYDDGPGGADPDSAGLTGLRHRVEALDGTLRVMSAPGRGTTIRAELPCAS